MTLIQDILKSFDEEFEYYHIRINEGMLGMPHLKKALKKQLTASLLKVVEMRDKGIVEEVEKKCYMAGPFNEYIMLKVKDWEKIKQRSKLSELRREIKEGMV